MKQSNFWAVIPAFNEASNIRSVIENVRNHTSNIVVVNDGSKDNTGEIAESLGVVTLSHVVNLGKGCALKTGCDYALIKGAERIVVLDADAQHKPEDIPRFIDALRDADIVFGYREMNLKMPSVLRFGNWFINTVAKVLFGVSLKDTQCGYRAFTSDAYRKIRWKASDYSMESEMVANTGKQKLRYKEIPIETVYLDRYKGTTVMTGVKIVINMLSWRVR